MSYKWRGVLYPTQRAVAEAAGCHPDTVWNHLDQNGDLDRLGCYVPGPRLVELDGKSWPSRKAFADYCGVAANTVSDWICRGRHDLMRRAVMRVEEHIDFAYGAVAKREATE